MNLPTRFRARHRLAVQAQAQANPQAPAARPAVQPPLQARTRALPCAAALSLAMLVTLAACSSTPPPEPQLYRLPLELNNAAATAPTASAPAAQGHWQLLRPVRLPEQLDQEALLLPDAGTGVLRMSGHRWAEPLRDAVPRVLMHDLGRLLGGAQVFDSPLPSGLVVARQLRLDIQALEATPDRRQLRLLARWTLADPTGRTAPLLGSARIELPTTGTGPDALVAAHRQALWQLAQQMARQSSGGASTR